jgi:hypothetical protein
MRGKRRKRRKRKRMVMMEKLLKNFGVHIKEYKEGEYVQQNMLTTTEKKIIFRRGRR